MQGVLNWRKCKECGEAFDIGTNCDLCPKCRGFDDNDFGIKEEDEVE